MRKPLVPVHRLSCSTTHERFFHDDRISFPDTGDKETAKFHAIQAAAEGADAVLLAMESISEAEISAIEDTLSVPLLLPLASVSSIGGSPAVQPEALKGGYVISFKQVTLLDGLALSFSREIAMYINMQHLILILRL